MWPVEYQDLPSQKLEQLRSLQFRELKKLIKEQFSLSYYANISISDMDKMSHLELLLFLDELKDVKAREKAAIEKVNK